MRGIYCILIVMLLAGLPFLPAMAQETLDLDISMEMPNIETIEGSMSVPAPLGLLLQGIIKIFADGDGDGNITQAEADDFLNLMPEDERENLSLSLDDLEPHIQNSIGIDFRAPAPPPPAQPQANTCPVCRGPLSYVQQFQRYYCNNCRQYR